MSFSFLLKSKERQEGVDQEDRHADHPLLPLQVEIPIKVKHLQVWKCEGVVRVIRVSRVSRVKRVRSTL